MDREKTFPKSDFDEFASCRLCGGRLSVNARFCPHCGEPTSSERPQDGDNVFNDLAGCTQALMQGLVGLLFLYLLVSAGCSFLLRFCELQ